MKRLFSFAVFVTIVMLALIAKNTAHGAAVNNGPKSICELNLSR